MKRVLYVFTGGRKERLAENATHGPFSYPQELLFGLPYLRANGYEVDILELDDLFYNEHSIHYKYFSWENRIITAFTGLNSSKHLFCRTRHRLNRYDVVIACNEYVASGISYLKRKGLFDGELIFFVMGMLDKVAHLEKVGSRFLPVARKIYKRLITSSKDVVFIGKGEFNYANRTYPGERGKFHFIPFAIDTEFWISSEKERQRKDYILFVGNDKHRDFECVVKTAKQMTNQSFIVISRNSQCEALKSSLHVTLIAGDWKDRVLTDEQVRDYYRNAALLILPLKQTLQPSGQSVALQAMACGKPVLITKTEGFWEPDSFVQNKHLVFMETNHHDEWVHCIQDLLGQEERLAEIGANSQRLVKQNNNLDRFGNCLVNVIHE